MDSGTGEEVRIRLKRNGVSLTDYTDHISLGSEDEEGIDFTDVIYCTSGQYLELEWQRYAGSGTATLTQLYWTVEKIN